MSAMKKTTEPTRTEVLALASKACVDERTARKALRGEDVRGLAGARIKEAMRGMARRGAAWPGVARLG